MVEADILEDAEFVVLVAESADAALQRLKQVGVNARAFGSHNA